MSESASEVIVDTVTKAVESIINESNLTNGTNETEKFKATPQGLFIAYSSLLIMALIPIIVGSFKSVKLQSNQKVRQLNLNI
jgi:minor histocompatibility antigen H13